MRVGLDDRCKVSVVVVVSVAKTVEPVLTSLAKAVKDFTFESNDMDDVWCVSVPWAPDDAGEYRSICSIEKRNVSSRKS